MNGLVRMQAARHLQAAVARGGEAPIEAGAVVGLSHEQHAHDPRVRGALEQGGAIGIEFREVDVGMRIGEGHAPSFSGRGTGGAGGEVAERLQLLALLPRIPSILSACTDWRLREATQASRFCR